MKQQNSTTQVLPSTVEPKKEAPTNDNLGKKIVIRRLPPTLTREQFLDIVSPLPDHDYFYFCPADLRYFLN